MNVAASLNRKYVLYTIVMLTSLCENNKDEHIDAYIMHSELEPEDFAKFEQALEKYDITVIPTKIDWSRFNEKMPTTREWTKEMYYRLLLTEVLPQGTERIIYLDVDIIVNKNIMELYNCPFEGDLLFAAEDAGGFGSLTETQNAIFSEKLEQGFKYFNSGVMVLNIAGLRSEGYTLDTYLEDAARLDYKLFAPDQDLLNDVHWNRVGYFDSHVYNQFSRLAHNDGITYDMAKRDIAIIHFSGDKPWTTSNVHYDIERIWWEYAKLTPFYMELLEGFLDLTLKDGALEWYIKTMYDQLKETDQKLKESMEVNQKLLALLKRK